MRGNMKHSTKPIHQTHDHQKEEKKNKNQAHN